MGKIDKLLERFKSKPKDFTYNELKKVLNYFEYVLLQGSGSRVVFTNKKRDIKLSCTNHIPATF